VRLTSEASHVLPGKIARPRASSLVKLKSTLVLTLLSMFLAVPSGTARSDIQAGPCVTVLAVEVDKLAGNLLPAPGAPATSPRLTRT
jgi:hypothetical protein